jgi:hypothetical protein
MMRKYAALTMVRDETLHLKLWHRYYATQFGAENLYIIDHNSKRDLPRDVIGQDCNVFRIPFDNSIKDPKGDLRQFDNVRFEYVSAQINALLEYYDCVIFNDADELYFVDGPLGLREYLDSLPDISVRAGVGANVLHHIATEPAYDFDASLFSQRRFFQYNLNFTKPWIISEPCTITGHGVMRPFHIDPNLMLIHLRWFDHTMALERQQLRVDAFAAGRGGMRSKWAESVDDVDMRFQKLMKRSFERTRMGRMPHREFMEEMLPKYTEQEFSARNYAHVSGRADGVMQVSKFVDRQIMYRVQKQVFKFPEGYKTAFI